MSKSYARAEPGPPGTRGKSTQKTYKANTCGLQTAYSVHWLLDNAVGDAVSTLGRLDKTLCGYPAAQGVTRPRCCPAAGIMPHLRSTWTLARTLPRGQGGSRAVVPPHGVQPHGPVRGKCMRFGGGDTLGMRQGGTRAWGMRLLVLANILHCLGVYEALLVGEAHTPQPRTLIKSLEPCSAHRRAFWGALGGLPYRLRTAPEMFHALRRHPPVFTDFLRASV